MDLQELLNRVVVLIDRRHVVAHVLAIPPSP